MKQSRKAMLAGVATFALVGGVVGVAQASPSAPTTIKGCVSKATGLVRTYSNQTGACHTWETPLTWNIKGETGPRGLTGLTGKTGAPGLNGAKGKDGVNGKDGAPGLNGAHGKDATYNGGHWGVVHRNVIGNGDAELAGSSIASGLGQGALELRTGSAADKAAFGNETDFKGLKVSALSAIGYSVFTTGENNALAANNMPSITFEIDPNVIGSGNYTSLVYAPDNSAANKWTTIDAKGDAGRHWGLTGSFFNADPSRCGINGSRCTFDEVMTYLATNNDATQGEATLFTAQITKGRDFAFSGAVDGLLIGGTTYDFEPLGVYATAK